MKQTNDDHIRLKHDSSWYTAQVDKEVLEAWAGKGISTEIAAMRLGQNNGTYVSPEQFVKFANGIGWFRKQ